MVLAVHQHDSAFYGECKAQEGVLCSIGKSNEVAEQIDNSCMIGIACVCVLDVSAVPSASLLCAVASGIACGNEHAIINCVWSRSQL